MISDQWQVLYGSGDGGTWYVLRGILGRVPPQELDGVPLLGETTELMRKVLNFRMRMAKRATEATLEMAQRVHDTLAGELGIEPDYLTGCIMSSVEPGLSSTGWSRLAKAAHFIPVTTG